MSPFLEDIAEQMMKKIELYNDLNNAQIIAIVIVNFFNNFTIKNAILQIYIQIEV